MAFFILDSQLVILYLAISPLDTLINHLLVVDSLPTFSDYTIQRAVWHFQIIPMEN